MHALYMHHDDIITMYFVYNLHLHNEEESNKKKLFDGQDEIILLIVKYNGRFLFPSSFFPLFFPSPHPHPSLLLFFKNEQ